MEMVMGDEVAVEAGLVSIAERLAAAAGVLEQAVAGLMAQQSALAVSAEAGVERIVATVESAREAELERRLVAAEAEIAELRAGTGNTPTSVTYSGAGTQGRKTLPASMVNLLAKQGVAVDSISIEAGALDAALNSLSIEQRIAVKAQLMRAGLLG